MGRGGKENDSFLSSFPFSFIDSFIIQWLSLECLLCATMCRPLTTLIYDIGLSFATIEFSVKCPSWFPRSSNSSVCTHHLSWTLILQWFTWTTCTLMWAHSRTSNPIDSFLLGTCSVTSQQNTRDANKCGDAKWIWCRVGVGSKEASELTYQKPRARGSLNTFVNMGWRGSTSRGSLRELQIIKMTFVSGLFSIMVMLVYFKRIFFR